MQRAAYRANSAAEGRLLAKAVAAGDRRALARAVTIVESRRADHAEAAGAMLAELGDLGRSALRVGLTGTPGVGKSTFIEAFGKLLTARGLRVAVLAVDPSSTRTGGAILGDKTRMPELSRDPNAFIRPSPSQTALGGVARQTQGVIALCEGAGFDVILVETVGVGQSETMVADMTDLFVLLIAPAGGDELQGVKRGIMELADLVLVNKADGDLAPAATRTAADYAGALRLIRPPEGTPEGFPKAMTVSALTGDGLPAAWAEMDALASWRREAGVVQERRKKQAVQAFLDGVDRTLLAQLKAARQTEIEAMADAVAAGDATVPDAIAEVVSAILKTPDAP